MQQRKWRAFRRGWVALYILGVGGIGALASGWSGGPRSTALSSAQMVALRFPDESEELQPPDEPAASDVPAAIQTTADTASTSATADVAAGMLATASIVGGTRLALLSPTPISPETALQAEDPLPAALPAQHQSTTLRSPHPGVAPLLPVVHHAALPPKPVAAPVHKPASHPGFVLNDSQIASIKRRLQLSPDQERMWPAVEAALRSIAYAKAHGEGRRHPGPASASELANIDPNSPEVQGLKSAAFPLILSFNSDQKTEVRTLAHVMGLDQLAAQF